MPLSAAQVVSRLKSGTFLGCLSDEILGALVRGGSSTTYPKGQTLCWRGDAGDCAYVVLSGKLKVTNTTADGREVGLNFIGIGDVVGEIGLLDGKERTATVSALEDSEVFVLHRRDLLPILAAHPESMLEIVRALCEKLRLATAIIEGSAHDMAARLADGLIRLANQHGVTRKGRIRIELEMSQTDLGNYIGLSRANVSRQLARFKTDDIIALEGGKIVIINEERLAKVASTVHVRRH